MGNKTGVPYDIKLSIDDLNSFKYKRQCSMQIHVTRVDDVSLYFDKSPIIHLLIF